jgi:hypothetical protein
MLLSWGVRPLTLHSNQTRYEAGLALDPRYPTAWWPAIWDSFPGPGRFCLRGEEPQQPSIGVERPRLERSTTVGRKNVHFTLA